MTQSSYPKAKAAEQPLGEAQWKQLMLPLGRGILDEGGSPYRVTARDSVTDRVTIGVDTIKGYNSAVLDGFLHYMDAPEQLSLPPVSVDTFYSIGLVFDPTKISDLTAGPITLTVWKGAPDTRGGKSYLTLHVLLRKPNVALGSTPVESQLPRAVPVISVSTVDDLPTSGLVLVDTIALVRVTGQMYAAAIGNLGAVSWLKIGAVDILAHASTTPVAGKLVQYGNDGGFLVIDPTHPKHPATKGYIDDNFASRTHTHSGDQITGTLRHSTVIGSDMAWQNSNLGSEWTSVAVNSTGRFGRYPSARKYKKNIRPWAPDPQTIIDMVPVTYDVKVTTAGASESSDKGLVGFTADDYVDTLRQLVLKVGDEVEGFHYHLMPVAQQVVLRWHEDRVKTLEADNTVLRHNLDALAAHLGLSIDADGRLVIEGEVVEGDGRG